MTLRLNLGCGSTFAPGWDNIDFVAAPGVRQCDLRAGIPYPDECADVTYSSHVLEHFSLAAGRLFIAEQFRVLKPGGVIRVVVPDLEAICRNYCACLDAILSGDPKAEFRYDYSVIELLDQSVRETSGGEMRRLWTSPLNDDERAFAIRRSGHEFLATTSAAPRWPKQALLSEFLRRIPSKSVRIFARLLLGRSGEAAVHEGLFRAGGETHRWMYDRFSLPRLLRAEGFVQPVTTKPAESSIPGFARDGLEIVDGAERKPDSLYVEARKP